MNKAIFGTLAVLALLVIAGCAQTGNVTSEPIKIGLVSPLTGGDAGPIGQSTLKAATLAVEEINAKGGVNGRPLQLIAEDGKCNGKDAASAVNKLINIDKVDYIVGGQCSSETLGAAPIAEVSQALMISPCSSSPDVTDAGDYIFRLYPSDAYQGKYAADLLYSEGARTAVTLSCQSDYCIGVTGEFEKRFKELGGTILESHKFPQGTTDLRTELSKTKDKNPDAIYVGAYVESSAAMLKQASELGIPASKFFSTETWSTQDMWNAVGTKGDGARYTTLAGDLPKEFESKYYAAFNNAELTICSPQTYDAVYLYAAAIAKSGDNVDAVKQTFYDLESFKGVSGNIKFDENGDIVGANYQVNIVVNGETQKAN